MTDEGVIGYGEAFGSPKVIVALIKDLEPFFTGVDVSALPNTVVKVMNTLYHASSKGYLVCALSGIEMAGWDAFGKTLHLPVYQLLGGKARSRFMPYASTGYITRTKGLEILKNQTEQAKALQMQAIKIKIGRNLRDDIDRVRTVREAAEEIKLLVDINGNYTADQSMRVIKELEPYNLYWVEEPVPFYDLEGLRKIKNRFGEITISTGEAEYTRYGFREIIQQGLADVVQPDLAKCGGIYEAKAISVMAQANNIRVSPHIWGGLVGRAAAAHLMASIPFYPHSLEEPEPMLFEYDLGENALRDELGQGPLRLKDGWIELSEDAGLGVYLDDDKVSYYRID
jgi:D-galactarolactone cycloisomerase